MGVRKFFLSSFLEFVSLRHWFHVLSNSNIPSQILHYNVIAIARDKVFFYRHCDPESIREKQSPDRLGTSSQSCIKIICFSLSMLFALCSKLCALRGGGVL